MIRRTFLATGLAAPLAAVEMPVRIGFLGASHSHARSKILLAKSSSDFEIVGLWDDDDTVRSGYEGRGLPIIAPDRLLGDETIAAIAVEGPVADHARDGLRVVRAGKHLHIEKPPALDVESLREILSTAEDRGLVVQQGYMWRYHPGLSRMLDAARRGWLGDIHLVQASIHKTMGPEQRSSELAEFRGGEMFELGAHVVDPLVRLLGRPNRVTPYLKKHGEFDDTFADNTLAVFEYSNALGIVLSAALSGNGSRYRSFEVHGTLGVATLRPIEPRLVFDLVRAAGPYPKGRHEVELPPYERYVDDLGAFAAAIRGEKPLHVSFREDIVVQEALIEACGM